MAAAARPAQPPAAPPPALLSVAPMMEWTTRHYRFLARLLSRRTLLYTEMVVDNTLLFSELRDGFLRFHPAEHPIACQLGGSNPETLAAAARMVEAAGYDEINLNCGCPSAKVAGRGTFGARLMFTPELVRDCVAAMRAAVAIPVTVKCRLGADHMDSYDAFAHFVRVVASGGCEHFIVHARKCVLKGLTPKDNRTIPPLRYEWVQRLAVELPGVRVSLNGGVGDLATAGQLLALEREAPRRGGPAAGAAAAAGAGAGAAVDGGAAGGGGGDACVRQLAAQLRGMPPLGQPPAAAAAAAAPPCSGADAGACADDDHNDDAAAAGCCGGEEEEGEGAEEQGQQQQDLAAAGEGAAAAGRGGAPPPPLPPPVAGSSLLEASPSCAAAPPAAASAAALAPPPPLAWRVHEECVLPPSPPGAAQLLAAGADGRRVLASVMVGRAAYHNSWGVLATADSELHGAPDPGLSRRQVIARYLDYCDGVFGSLPPEERRMSHYRPFELVKPLLGLFHGVTGGQRFRHALTMLLQEAAASSEEAARQQQEVGGGAPVDPGAAVRAAVTRALEAVPPFVLDETPGPAGAAAAASAARRFATGGAEVQAAMLAGAPQS